MKVFITGGAGFIGSNLADHYLSKGIETTIYDNLSRNGTKKNLQWLKKRHPKLTFLKSDIRDFPKLKRAIKGSTTIFHLASQVAVTTSIKDPRSDFEINATGTLNVLEAARMQKKPPVVIYTSTNKVYGGMEQVKAVEKKTRYEFRNNSYKQGIDENFNLDFHSPYGCSKGAGDQYVHDYSRIYGLKTIVFRQSCIYGNRQFGNEDQGWIAHFALQALRSKPITIFGDGKQVRDILSIEDLINCYLQSLEHLAKTSGQVYNVGGGRKNSISLLELLAALENKLECKIKTSFQPWRSGDQPIFISDNSKAKKDFNWQPKIDIKKGLDKLLDWLESISS